MRPNNCPGNTGSEVSGKPRQTPNAHNDVHPRDRHTQSTPAVCHDYGNLQQPACKRRRLQSAPTSPKVRPEQEKHHHTLSPSVYLSAAAAPAPCTPRGSCSCNAQCCFRSSTTPCSCGSVRMRKAIAPCRSRNTKAARPWWRSSCGQEHTGGRELLALLMAALGVLYASEPVAKS